TSIITGQPVSDIISDRLPNTLRLVGAAFVFTIGVAYPLGLGMAIFTQNGRHRRTEVGFAGVTGFMQSIPDFVLATALVALFGVTWQILPVAESSGASAYVLPVLSLTLGSIAVLSRIIRLEALRVLGEDYIRTARSKRLPARIVYVRHALPNMLTASLTISGLFLAGLVAGTVLVENVFAWPGIGSTVVRSVIARDYPIALTLSLLLAAITLAVNLIVDILLAIIDPRSVIKEH
ncbi:MAG TPA: ABC transporter permease, partial [Desertimonas sp.]|nr:ABC transporter permease [Desertimonas sp.]